MFIDPDDESVLTTLNPRCYLGVLNGPVCAELFSGFVKRSRFGYTVKYD
ncbi:hypothetical protein MPTK1_7g16210 [Marchantia polymorpha subsp. ruderalis]